MAGTGQSCTCLCPFHSGTQALDNYFHVVSINVHDPAYRFMLGLQKLLCCIASNLSLGGSSGLGTEACLIVPQEAASVSGLYSLLQQQGLIQSNPALAVLLAAHGIVQGSWLGGGALPLSRPTDAGQAAALASTIAASCHPYTRVEDTVMACHAMTASDLVPFTSRDTMPNYLNAASVMATMADWPYQPAVPPPQPDVPFNLHREHGLADSLDSYLGSGPQRHNHVTNMRSARHSPY